MKPALPHYCPVPGSPVPALGDLSSALLLLNTTHSSINSSLDSLGSTQILVISSSFQPSSLLASLKNCLLSPLPPCLLDSLLPCLLTYLRTSFSLASLAPCLLGSLPPYFLASMSTCLNAFLPPCLLSPSPYPGPFLNSSLCDPSCHPNTEGGVYQGSYTLKEVKTTHNKTTLDLQTDHIQCCVDYFD